MTPTTTKTSPTPSSLHQQLPAPWFVIPGNHDVGDNGAEPWQDQPPTPDRLERFVERWGADRFSIDLDGWRILGANNLLVGTGLAAEEEQEDWLRQHLHGHDRVALFVHKPICLTHPVADDGLGGPLELPGPAALLVDPRGFRRAPRGVRPPAPLPRRARCPAASRRCGRRPRPSSAVTEPTVRSAGPASSSTSSTATTVRYRHGDPRRHARLRDRRDHGDVRLASLRTRGAGGGLTMAVTTPRSAAVVDREALVAFAQALVRIPSVHDPARRPNEAPVGRASWPTVSPAGAGRRVVEEVAPGRPNVICVVEGGLPGPDAAVRGPQRRRDRG